MNENLLINNIAFISKVTNSCNLNCSYCYYKNSLSKNKKIMSDNVLEEVITKTLENNDKAVNFLWHGGEPLICGLDFFNKIVEFQKIHNSKNLVIYNSVQTNALLLDKKFVNFFKDNNFDIGVSLDGPFYIHEAGRNTTQAQYDTIINNLKYATKNHRVSGICVVTPYSLGHEQEIFDTFLDTGIKNIVFYPLNDDDSTKAINPKLYGDFLVNMFNIWIHSGIRGVSIREFREFLMWKKNLPLRLCCMLDCCKNYYSVTYDGNVYPCDLFKSVDDIKLGTVFDNFEHLKERSAEFYKNSNIVYDQCKTCEYLDFCKCGCRYYRYMNSQDFSKPSYFCDSFKRLYQEIEKALQLYSK